MQLIQDQDIIFKEADKSGAIVIMDKKDYLGEVYRKLGDSQYYQSVTSDPTDWILNLVKITIQEALILNHINYNIAKYLVNELPKVPVFYILPNP